MSDETEQVSEAAVMPAAEPEVLPARTPDPSDAGPHVVDTPPAPGELPAGVQPSRNYQQAVELGHVLAASGYYTDAREPAKAAVKVMIGMDLGLSPTAALQGIHTMEERGKVVFLIEGKLLAAVLRRHPVYDYQFATERRCTRCGERGGDVDVCDLPDVDDEDQSCGGRVDDVAIRGPERVVLEITRDGETIPPAIEWTIERAKQIGLATKDNWKNYPAEMLTWRAMAEGVRIHAPDVLAGQPIYTDAEFGVDVNEVKLREALEPGAEPLTDKRAEEQRERAREVYVELKAINPDRLVPGRFASMVAGAEHSHERLDGVIEALEDLRDTEQQLADLRIQVAEFATVAEAKEILARAERKGSQRERIDVLREALDKAGETPDEKEGTDG